MLPIGSESRVTSRIEANLADALRDCRRSPSSRNA